MDNELIQLFFDPATENIDWEKRKPRITPQKQTSKSQEKNNKTITSSVKLTSRMPDNFKSYIAEVNIRIDEYRQSGSKELKNKLADDYKIMCVNFDNYGRPLEMSNCIKRLYSTVYCNRVSNKDTTTRTTSKPQLAYSERGLQIQNRLKEIKPLIKQKLEPVEINDLRNELIFLREELTNSPDIFSKFDNIPIKISQIDSYLSKIGQATTTDSLNIINANKAETDNKNESKVSGQTQRGIEIQEELAVLREETKRKDLNPIEKENLTNALIKLQNEITSNMEKFSKFDSIPVRLTQIENYLEKLKDKEEIKPKPTGTMHKTDVEEKKDETSKKKKMQVIWKFGL